MTNKDTFRTGTPDGSPLLNNNPLNNKDMPDVFYAHKFTGDNSSGKWFSAKVYTANWTKCYSQSHIDELTQQHEAELKAHSIAFFYWWHNQSGTNTEQGYESYLEHLNAKVKDDE